MPPRRSRTAPASGDEPARRGYTGRATVLALVVCALALVLAYPLRELVAQQQRIGELLEQVRAQEQEVAALETARERWQDPAYVRAQARGRLHYVLPGETQYVVLEPDEAPAPDAAPGTAPDERRPWFTTLWQSVAAADAAGTDPVAPGPAAPGPVAPGSTG